MSLAGGVREHGARWFAELHRIALWVRMAGLRPQRSVAHVTVGPPPACSPGPPCRRADTGRPTQGGPPPQASQPAGNSVAGYGTCMKSCTLTRDRINAACSNATWASRLADGATATQTAPNMLHSHAHALKYQCRVMHGHSFTGSRTLSRFDPQSAGMRWLTGLPPTCCRTDLDRGKALALKPNT